MSQDAPKSGPDAEPPPPAAYPDLDAETVLDEGGSGPETREGPRPKLVPKAGEIPREIPVRLGKYIIDGEIGRGAMGVVFKAHQEDLNRIVALKLLLMGEFASSSQRERFTREARAIAKLRHANIVAVHEVGDYLGQPFFTMDYIDGVALDDFISQFGIVDTKVLADLCATLADAVQYAHDQGIVHRDLKPGNILVDRAGRPIVTDFGLAKDLDSQTLFSMTGDIMGTPAYMSPEQASGHVSKTDEASDVYSLGAILYSMLARKPPFEGKTLVETLGQVIHDDPVPLTFHTPTIEGELGAICMKAMEKEPGKRYASAGEMAEDLRNFINGYPVKARPWTWRRAFRKFAARNRTVLGIVVVAAVLVILVAVVSPLYFSESYLDMARGQLAAESPQSRADAIRTLAREIERMEQLRPDQRDEAIDLIVGAHVDPDRDVQTAVLEFLAEHGDTEGVGEEITELHSAWLMATASQNEDPERRNLAIAALGAIRKPDHATYLIDRLSEPNASVRLKIVRSLGQMRSPKAIGPLMKIKAYDPVCRAEADAALDQFYSRGRITPFDSQDRAIKNALNGLGDAMEIHNRQIEQVQAMFPGAGPTDAGPFGEYEAILRKGSSEEKQQAVFELGRTGDPAVAPLLLKALEDQDGDVGMAAAMALAQVDRTGQRQALLDLLSNPSARVRANAALALGFSRSPDVVDPLLVALAREPHIGVTRNMIFALGEIGSPDAIPALIIAAREDSRVRDIAEEAVNRIRQAGAASPGTR